MKAQIWLPGIGVFQKYLDYSDTIADCFIGCDNAYQSCWGDALSSFLDCWINAHTFSDGGYYSDYLEDQCIYWFSYHERICYEYRDYCFGNCF